MQVNYKMAAELIAKALEGKASGDVKGGADVTATGNDVGQSENDTDIKAKEDIVCFLLYLQ